MSRAPGAAGAPVPVRVLAHNARTAAGLAWAAASHCVAGLLILAAAVGVAPVVTAWLTREVLDGLVDGVPGRQLAWLAVALAASGVALVVLPQLGRYAEAELGRRVRVVAADRLYTAIHQRLRGLARLEDPSFHNRIRLAQQAASTGPADMVNGAIGIATNVVTLCGFLVTLWLMNRWLVLAVVVSAIPTVRAELRLSRMRAAAMWSISHASRRQHFYANLLSAPREAKEIRLFGLGGYFQERMLAEQSAANATDRRVDRSELGMQVSLGLLGAAVAGGGLVWAILAARSGRLTVGDVTVFVAAVAAVQAALSGIAGKFGAVHHALLMLDHFGMATTVPPDLPVTDGAEPIPALREAIRLDNVWFRYAPDRPWVLRGVNLTIPAGRATALVGLNGAGKSTLVKLLCRLYEPTEGRILWDGRDIRDVDPADLRQHIGTVFQDYVEYELSAADNIGLGDVAHRTDRPRIEEAAGRAGMHETLSRLPKGYDTMLTRMFLEGVDAQDADTGVLLSGGQGQRLALARAFFRNDRDLLILDEPSSGLDAEAEAELHRQLREYRQSRTSLLISHRLNTVRDADQIAVLSDGVIAEIGDHEELIALDGIYAGLFNLQADGYAKALPS
ncbi:ABC transporter ATP-binding protein [Jidongwangia harbinensis]|uniref:ABC transporter ATP-binding protein n=1 Tax=Jidongwangia harbinensis TaxID=2878561 RepID=UPI001CD9DDA8|nr:ABC transporter ATP-binding protein [Jidongwangia harbinensis]MCA2213522.1 ABC transporter ATP-binding protein/permease [Jidongwangia harbinensis]